MTDECRGDENARHPYLSGNFAPIQSCLPLTPCSHEGTIPSDLAGGQYVRNGGNPVTNDDASRAAHWFDGDGMLSGVLFRRAGEKNTLVQPEFVNQYLLTDVYCHAKTNKYLRRPVVPSIATLVNPAVSMFRILFEVFRTVFLVVLSRLPGFGRPIKKISVANTSVLFHNGRALATCESGPPLRFALPSLETIGWFNGRTAENEPRQSTESGFGGRGVVSFMREWTTAHPRVDPVTKELITFHATFVQPFVRYSVVPATTKSGPGRSPVFDLPVPGVESPKMMHDFGVSRQHTVIMDLPLSLDTMNLIRGVPSLSYDSAGRSRFGVFPRHQPDAVQWFETNPCTIFHTANCWESISSQTDVNGPRVSVNLVACRLTSASMVFSAGNLPTPEMKPVPPEYAEEEQCRLYYYSFPLSAIPGIQYNIRHQWALSAISLEFPSVAPAYSMQEARYVYGCSTGEASYTVALGKAAKIDHLAKFDVRTLIARGVAQPPQPVKGCVDTRSIAQVMESQDPQDPIKLFRMPVGWYAQEPRFVPRREPDSEDDGWLLTYVFNEDQLDEQGECVPEAASELWIIDAKEMKGVVARIKLPQRVPYGLHGTWFSEEEIDEQKPFEKVRTLAA
ncbi:retinal pigment epithelial membrane protein [Colletotrichum abscissum]|uniref:Retinal pigment epithelial membrane protein n=1 Tax=Colletotrichum abscissum TaxID=1671311 RepID=A0A9P9XSR0_9PEZI|nr:retinal pigment epithelial membrane protein [Colletotrichum abscissum]KAI3559041.1 retinal pigment epithelial membrane protein [Colletotrichum abscissum]KAK1484911.1 retinal pigment epithelial membrane protein [Colletotrichum abscissum]